MRVVDHHLTSKGQEEQHEGHTELDTEFGAVTCAEFSAGWEGSEKKEVKNEEEEEEEKDGGGAEKGDEKRESFNGDC